MALKAWVLYDGRACGGIGTDDAAVIVCCNDEDEADSYKGDFGSMACYSYDVIDGELINERWEWDWHP